MKIFLILGLASFAACVQAQDYCKLNCGIQTHVGCNHSMSFGTACGSGAEVVVFNQTLVDVIIKKHNFFRNMVAGGGLANFSTASRMTTMLWHTELAQLATLNTMNCIMRHDCHNTKEFVQSGQNLFNLFGTKVIDVTVALHTGMNMWFAEHQYANMTHIKSYPSAIDRGVIGHFTAMIGENNKYVGCGATLYHNANKNYFLLACNYATTNILGLPVYTVGIPTSKCNSVPNPNYANLCY